MGIAVRFVVSATAVRFLVSGRKGLAATRVAVGAVVFMAALPFAWPLLSVWPAPPTVLLPLRDALRDPPLEVFTIVVAGRTGSVVVAGRTGTVVGARLVVLLVLRCDANAVVITRSVDSSRLFALGTPLGRTLGIADGTADGARVGVGAWTATSAVTLAASASN